jgi:hypothetical protein
MGCPFNILSNHMQRISMGASQGLFCRNIMEACEAREYGSESKRKLRVEGAIMQAKEWTGTFGRCTRSRSMSVLEKNRAKRRREVSLPSSSYFVCSSLYSGTTLDLAIHPTCFVQQITS